MKKCKQGGHKCRLLHEKMQAELAKTPKIKKRACSLIRYLRVVKKQ